MGNIFVTYKDGTKKEFQFDEAEEIMETGGYFLVPCIAGIMLFDKRKIKKVIKK